MDKLIDLLSKLENAGYRLSQSKSKVLKTEIEWIGSKIDQNRIRLLQYKRLAMKELKKKQKMKKN